MSYRMVMASRSVGEYIRDTGLAIVSLVVYANVTPYTEGNLKRWIKDSDRVLKKEEARKQREVAAQLARGGEHSPEHVPQDVSI